ncbi:MAG: Kelch repeat-containing protein, partial [Kiloniellaceae bacterium]
MDLPASTRTIAALLLATLFAAAWARPGLAGGAWTAAAAMPTARSELAAAALDGRIYVAGGLATFGGTKVFEVYDPAADRWDRLAQLPRSLHHFGMAAARGRIYLTGGYSGLSFSADSAEAWAYDPAGDDWTRLPDMPAPRAAHGMVNLGDKLYVVGGVGPHATALWV